MQYIAAATGKGMDAKAAPNLPNKDGFQVIHLKASTSIKLEQT